MKKFICTRPFLTRELMKAGQTGEEIPNPWQPARTAWLFPVTDELTAIVSDYYGQIGKPLPAILQGGNADD